MVLVSFKDAHEDGVWCVDWFGGRLITGSVAGLGGRGGRVKTWKRTSTGIEREHVLEGHSLAVVSVSLSHSLPLAVSSSFDGLVRIWDLSAQQPTVSKDIECEPGASWGVKFNLPDGSFISTTGQGGAIALWNATTGDKKGSFQSSSKFATCTAFSPNGKLLACGGMDGSTSLFDIESGRRLHIIAGHSMPLRSLTFSSDSSTLLVASDDGTISAHDVQNAQLLASFTGHTSWVLSVISSSSSGRMFASSSADKTVKIWDLSTKSHVKTFSDHQDQVWGIAFNNDGSELASVSDDHSLVINSMKF